MASASRRERIESQQLLLRGDSRGVRHDEGVTETRARQRAGRVAVQMVLGRVTLATVTDVTADRQPSRTKKRLSPIPRGWCRGTAARRQNAYHPVRRRNSDAAVYG